MFVTPTLCDRTVDTAFRDDESYVSGQPGSLRSIIRPDRPLNDDGIDTPRLRSLAGDGAAGLAGAGHGASRGRPRRPDPGYCFSGFRVLAS